MKGKFTIIFLIICLVSGILISCGGDSETNSDKSKSVEIIPEMKEFMGMLNGDYKKVGEALNKFAVSGLDTVGMEDYDLEKPEVVNSKEENNGITYVLHVKSGATKRSYEMFWKNGKIESIKDTGFVFD